MLEGLNPELEDNHVNWDGKTCEARFIDGLGRFHA